LLRFFARQALTDGFHFTNDILSSLFSFPLELVSRLRRPTSHRGCSVMKPRPLDAGPAHSCDAGETTGDTLAGTEHDPAADYEHEASVDVPMEDCSQTANAASSTESVDMADSSMVPYIIVVVIAYDFTA